VIEAKPDDCVLSFYTYQIYLGDGIKKLERSDDIRIMKYTIFSLLALLALSCTDKKETVTIPTAPVSVESIQKEIKDKQYFTSRLALASPFELETKPSYDWMEDMKDTTEFFKNYYSERKKFSLSFLNDTAATIFDDDKTINGTYKIDNEKNEGEKDGFKLRISYVDTSMSFPGATEPMVMTSSFTITGIDENEIFLELPREYNNRKVLALLKKK